MHKPWFHEECSQFLDQRKQATIQWLQNQKQGNTGLKNVRREANRQCWNKEREYLIGKINNLETNRKNEYIRDLYSIHTRICTYIHTHTRARAQCTCTYILVHTRFVQKVSGLKLLWLFSGWDVFATSLDMFVYVLVTHDTSYKWLHLLSWL